MARWRRPPGPLKRTSAGYLITLDTDQRESLIGWLGELGALLTVKPSESPDGGHPANADAVGPGHGALRRLFPTAYHLDAEADAEYQQLMRSELSTSHLASIQRASAALASSEPLSEAGVMSFVAAINQLRLVIGTALDVSEDHDDLETHPAESRLYHYLSWLLEASLAELAVGRTKR